MHIVSRSSEPRLRLQSTGSVIVHSESEDEEVILAEPEPLQLPFQPPGPATRTRKAKEAQYRLGVGRPAIAGGSGARAVTRSLNANKGRRVKSRKSLRPTEETIVEGMFDLM